MPVNLNLLPTELSVSKSLSSLLKTLKALGVIAVAAFIVTALGITAYFVVEKLALNNIDAQVNALKAQVATQEKSEQQVILLKDRLSKISLIQSLPGSLSSFLSTQSLLLNLSPNTSVNQIQVDPVGATMSLGIKTNSDLSAFLSSIQKSNSFNEVGLTAFSLSELGYTVETQMAN
jgi:hypothetical protein